MGRRFQEAGYTDPKPLITAAGRPLISYVLEMFPGEENCIFICNNKHLATTKMKQTLKKLAPKGKIVGIDKQIWDGPVTDILRVADLLDDREPVLVSYCDFGLVWDWQHFKKLVARGRYDGAIIAYRGFHPHHFGPTLYGYMRVNDQQELLEIREKESFTKNRLEEYAAAGSYYFGSGELLRRYLAEAVKQDLRTGNEYYVSLPYNLMVRDKLKIYVYEVPQFLQLGTPHDVRVFNYWAEYFTNHFTPPG